jgi:hypothetical protein
MVNMIPVQVPRIEDEARELIVRPIGDVHIGNPYLDERFLERTIKEIKESPEMFWIGCGDYIEANLKRTKHHGVYSDLMNPKEQADEFVRLFLPIADKCLGFIAGNHDHRIKHDTSFDPAEIIARGLGVEDKYADDGLIVRLAFGKRTARGGRRTFKGESPCRYTFYVTHGSSGSALVSGQALALQRAGDVVTADVIVGAHVHSQIAYKRLLFMPNHFDRKDCTYMEQHFVNTGSFITYGGYARTARMRPQPVGVPHITLRTDCERITVTM